MTPILTLLSIILAGENLTRKDLQTQIEKATTVYRSLNGLAPDYLCSKLTYRSSVRDTNGKLAVSLIHSFIHSFILQRSRQGTNFSMPLLNLYYFTVVKYGDQNYYLIRHILIKVQLSKFTLNSVNKH